MTYETFAQKHGITVVLTEIPSRTDMWENDPTEQDADEDWSPLARHYVVTLKRHHQQGSFQYSVGRGFGESCPHRPSAEEVLESLALDARSAHNSTFWAWCREMDADADARKTEYLYHQCGMTAMRLRRVLGEETFRDFLALDTP